MLWSTAFPQCLQGSELWPCDKKAEPSSSSPSSPLTLFRSCSVSTLVVCMPAWPAANHPASSSSCTEPTQTFARLRVERTITACTVELNKAHALLSLLTAQNRLADKRPQGATRRQCCSQSGCVGGRAMWHKSTEHRLSHLISAAQTVSQ